MNFVSFVGLYGRQKAKKDHQKTAHDEGIRTALTPKRQKLSDDDSEPCRANPLSKRGGHEEQRISCTRRPEQMHALHAQSAA
jgi:hypothetical protein